MKWAVVAIGFILIAMSCLLSVDGREATQTVQLSPAMAYAIAEKALVKANAMRVMVFAGAICTALAAIAELIWASSIAEAAKELDERRQDESPLLEFAETPLPSMKEASLEVSCEDVPDEELEEWH